MKTIILLAIISLLPFSSDSSAMDKNVIPDEDNLSKNEQKRRKLDSNSHQKILQDESTAITDQKTLHDSIKEEDKKEEKLPEENFHPFVYKAEFLDDDIGDLLSQETVHKKCTKLTPSRGMTFCIDSTSNRSEKKGEVIQKPIEKYNFYNLHPQLCDKRNAYPHAYFFELNNEQPKIEVAQTIPPTTFRIFSEKEIQDPSLKIKITLDDFNGEEESIYNNHYKTSFKPNSSSKQIQDKNTIRADENLKKNITNNNAVFKEPGLPYRATIKKIGSPESQANTK